MEDAKPQELKKRKRQTARKSCQYSAGGRLPCPGWAPLGQKFCYFHEVVHLIYKQKEPRYDKEDWLDLNLGEDALFKLESIREHIKVNIDSRKRLNMAFGTKVVSIAILVNNLASITEAIEELDREVEFTTMLTSHSKNEIRKLYY